MWKIKNRWSKVTYDVNKDVSQINFWNKLYVIINASEFIWRMDVGVQ